MMEEAWQIQGMANRVKCMRRWFNCDRFPALISHCTCIPTDAVWRMCWLPWSPAFAVRCVIGDRRCPFIPHAGNIATEDMVNMLSEWALRPT